MNAMASQITSLTIVYSAVYSGADQSKHQSFASLAFVWGIHRRPVNSPRKWPVTRKMFPFDEVIMWNNNDITFTWQIACLNMGTVWILAQHQVIDRKVNTHDVDSNLKLHYIYSLYHDALRWRHNDHDGVSNHQPRGCLLNRSFGRRSKKTSKLRVTGLCEGNSPGPVNSPHKGPVTRKMFPFDDVIMSLSKHV